MYLLRWASAVKGINFNSLKQLKPTLCVGTTNFCPVTRVAIQGATIYVWSGVYLAQR